jgi:hypothetical protein
VLLGQGYHTLHGVVRDENGAMAEWWLRGKIELKENPVPVSLHPPWFSLEVVKDWTQVSQFRSWHLAAWAMAQPILTHLLRKQGRDVSARDQLRLSASPGWHGQYIPTFQDLKKHPVWNTHVFLFLNLLTTSICFLIRNCGISVSQK